MGSYPLDIFPGRERKEAGAGSFSDIHQGALAADILRLLQPRDTASPISRIPEEILSVELDSCH